MTRRMCDKGKIKANRGQGELEEYIPWIYPREFGGNGRGHRIKGWKVNRMYSLLSDLELFFSLIRNGMIQ